MKIFFVLLVMFTAPKTMSQDMQMVRHEVRMGETVKMVSIKYHVPPSEIYRLNKFAVEGIREGMILQFPAERKFVERVKKEEGILPPPPETATPGKFRGNKIRHEVKPGETLSGISDKYNIPMKDIKLANPEVEKGLQAGQVLTIRVNE